tara:strand:- start:1278 stop:1475 length:198 start_codon:yes stop_codon:yes gene_type:complete
MNINEIIKHRLTTHKEALIYVNRGLVKAKKASAKELYIEMRKDFMARISELEALKFQIETKGQTE